MNRAAKASKKPAMHWLRWLTRRDARGKWLRENGGLVAVFAVLALFLFPYPFLCPAAEFELALVTRSVTLRLADGFTGAELLTRAPHELTVVDCQPEAGEDARCFFENAKTELDLSDLDSLRIDWTAANPRAVRLLLRRRQPSAQPWGIVRDGNSVIKLASGKERLILIIAPPPSATLAPMSEVLDLREGSSLQFVDDQGRSAVVGRGSTLRIAATDRTDSIRVGDDLRVEALHDARIAGLTVADDGLHVEIDGEANTLLVRGKNRKPYWLEIVRRNETVETYVSTVVLIGTVIVTILTRLRLVRMAKE
jgi:hypothetical protein